MKMKFQWFFDIATSPTSMQVITVSAGGDLVRKRLWPQFAAHKYWKLGKVSMKLIPASTLPVDPTGLSYEVGDTTVDPRDQLNPGLVRITNGEDIFEDLTNVSLDKQRAIYYTMMLDTRWYKFSMQNGCQRSARPLYWQIGQLHQDYVPGSVTNVLDRYGEHILHDVLRSGPNGIEHNQVTGSDPHGIFQTGHKGRLGWMPTDGIMNVEDGDGEPYDTAVLSAIPEIEVFKLILPAAYKTKYYYRAYVTEEVYFSGPIVNNAVELTEAGHNYSMRSLDVFHVPSGPTQVPTLPAVVPFSKPVPSNDGGGN